MPHAVTERQGEREDHRLQRADVPWPGDLAKPLLQLRILTEIAEDQHWDDHIDQDVSERVILR